MSLPPSHPAPGSCTATWATPRPDLFQIISWVLVGLTVAAAGLLGWLGWSTVTGAPAGWGKTAIFGLLAALFWYAALVALPRMGNPPISKLRLWWADAILAIGGVLLATTLWTLYSLIK